MGTIRIGAGERVIGGEASWGQGPFARTVAKSLGFLGAVLLSSLISLLTGCGGGPTGPDETSASTTTGIQVRGTEPETFGAIDGAWNEVNRCWGTTYDGTGVQVTVLEPELRDKNGLGVIRYKGALCYGAREGYSVFVATDLAALRHEFSHLVGERAMGQSVDNGSGKCWL